MEANGRLVIRLGKDLTRTEEDKAVGRLVRAYGSRTGAVPVLVGLAFQRGQGTVARNQGKTAGVAAVVVATGLAAGLFSTHHPYERMAGNPQRHHPPAVAGPAPPGHPPVSAPAPVPAPAPAPGQPSPPFRAAPTTPVASQHTRRATHSPKAKRKPPGRRATKPPRTKRPPSGDSPGPGRPRPGPTGGGCMRQALAGLLRLTICLRVRL